jgi:hypothetical protein
MLISMIGDRRLLTEPNSRLTAQRVRQTHTQDSGSAFPDFQASKKQNNSNNNNKRELALVLF